MNEDKKDSNFIKAFNPITKCLGANASVLFGKIYNYTKMETGLCTASRTKISDELGIGYSTFDRNMKLLIQNELIEDLTPDLRNHPHTYKIKKETIDLLFQNEIPLFQNEILTLSKRKTHSFKMTHEKKDILKEVLIELPENSISDEFLDNYIPEDILEENSIPPAESDTSGTDVNIQENPKEIKVNGANLVANNKSYSDYLAEDDEPEEWEKDFEESLFKQKEEKPTVINGIPVCVLDRYNEFVKDSKG